MSEKKCRYCAKMIPEEAKICPHCKKAQGLTVVNVLAIVALITLTLSLGLTLISIYFQWESKKDFLLFTELIISWPIIAGGLSIGGASKFENEIKLVLNEWATKIGRYDKQLEHTKNE